MDTKMVEELMAVCSFQKVVDIREEVGNEDLMKATMISEHTELSKELCEPGAQCADIATKMLERA